MKYIKYWIQLFIEWAEELICIYQNLINLPFRAEDRKKFLKT